MPTGDVVASVESLPERFLPARADRLRARFRLGIGRLVRDVVIDDGTCAVEVPRGRPDAEITTSPDNWLAMDRGRLSGIEAFGAKRLSIRGSIQQALLFEPLFDRPTAGAMTYTVERVGLGRHLKISALVAGDPEAPPVVMMHGLGGTKASMLTIVPELARYHRVIAVDLPGFGSSSKPRGRYDAPWFADHMFAFLDAAGLNKVSLIGNSMGGKIAQEMAMRDPDRINALVCLCPATAFSNRPVVNVVRLLRPELGFAVPVPRKRVRSLMEDLFAKPARIDAAWYDAATDDFLRTWRSPRARMAFFAAARHIYLEEPDGDNGFWGRLQEMSSKAFYIYGRQDVLITPHFGQKVQGALPKARVEVWDDCGHVPQLEHPERTADSILAFLAGTTGVKRRRSDKPA
jgi:pimeloyl-ACP methyl ester carboxylesterase/putative sterol carrier protein